MNKEEIKKRDLENLHLYRKYLLKNPDLKFLFLEMTNMCNLQCRHCGSRCEKGKGVFLDTELIIKSLKEAAEDFKDRKYMVVVTGGEPLLHPGFDKIVNCINELNLPWGMTTNGILIDSKMAQHLKDLQIGSITLSLDGLKEEHDWLRQVDGSFDKTIEAIKNLKNVDLTVQVTTVVNKKTINQLDDIYSLMRNLNVDSWRVINVEPIGRALDNQDMMLSKEEIYKLLDYIRDKRFDNDNPMDVCFGCSHYVSFDYEREIRDFYFECGAGTHVLSILCNGDIYSCLDIERRPGLIQGNIAKDRLSEVWYNKFKEFRIDRTELCNTCKSCKEKNYCMADSMHTWDFDNNKPLLCMKGEI